jgi:glycosyltransferase involved in cell wall biosynthesis
MLLMSFITSITLILVFLGIFALYFNFKGKKKVLYITTFYHLRRRNLDGERIKNALIYDALQGDTNLILINLETLKLFSLIKMMILLILFRFDDVIVSKSSKGAYRLFRLLRQLPKRGSKLIYLVIAAYFAKRIKSQEFDLEVFKSCDLIVVETEALRQEALEVGLTKLEVFPNFKRIFKIEETKVPEVVPVLKLVFFSRVTEKKGILEAIRFVKELNTDVKRFTLDIFGTIDKPLVTVFKEALQNETAITYYGYKTLRAKEDYQILNQYDLHLLPTKYITEGIPASIIDFLIAGVPTLTSNFQNAASFLDDSFSYRYPFDDEVAFKALLLKIYENQRTLFNKRAKCLSESKKYSLDEFKTYLLLRL